MTISPRKSQEEKEWEQSWVVGGYDHSDWGESSQLGDTNQPDCETE